MVLWALFEWRIFVYLAIYVFQNTHHQVTRYTTEETLRRMSAIPDIVKSVGKFHPGTYTDVVAVDYDMIYLSVAEAMKHPEAIKARIQMNTRRTLFEEMSRTKDATLKKELESRCQDLKGSCVRWIEGLFKNPEMAQLLVEKNKEVILQHVQKLEKYGTVVGYECDTIFFSPKPQYKDMLEANKYFCTEINHPHSAYTQRRAQIMVVYGFQQYAIQVQFGDNPSTYKRIYKDVEATKANKDFEISMSITNKKTDQTP